jgi:hypothetical protein
MSAATPTLLYLVFGGEEYFRQGIFSILSALGHTGSDKPRIVIYTDQPERFAPLGCTTVSLDAAQLQQWRGPENYTFRPKIEMLRDAAKRFPGPWAWVDVDTQWKEPPAQLFAALKPGRVFMHCIENRMEGLLAHPQKRSYGKFLLENATEIRREFGVTVNEQFIEWNGGLIAYGPDAVSLLDDVLRINDWLLPRVPERWFVEQFCFSLSLARREIVAAEPYVLHYWPYKQQADAAIQQFMMNRGCTPTDAAQAAALDLRG